MKIIIIPMDSACRQKNFEEPGICCIFNKKTRKIAFYKRKNCCLTTIGNGERVYGFVAAQHGSSSERVFAGSLEESAVVFRIYGVCGSNGSHRNGSSNLDGCPLFFAGRNRVSGKWDCTA